MLLDERFRDLLDAFSSSAPTPGGGSAAAAASAMGAALLLMVAGLPKTRTGAEEERAVLTAAARELIGLRQQLAEAIDADTAAYDAVVAAYRLPKGSEEEQSTRKAAIQRAMRGATDVPLGVVRLSARALAQAKVVQAHGHKAASSDASVAAALLRAGLEGARLNVETNLASVTDAAYVDAIRTELGRIASGA